MSQLSESLMTVLDDLIRISKEDRNGNWLVWYEPVKTQLNRCELSAPIKILQAYGGMCSFNEHVLTELSRFDAHFSPLQSQVWQRNHQSPDSTGLPNAD
ncbi:DUF6966 domain-containing protein [Pseudoalteromonas ardens]|uniref:Uncharacterized protein n=1 Tax=Pseudoalteromonas rubra TaxID=43658 RepID=A0A0L0EQA1_9GAMM|nr:hypothetical protein [Pseudoalteromonas sp. R96]KNC66584.1 hypothetical protein AC626_16035 [Pseudoalteromonas rubra]MDK1310871.1 hypothetical protein [Pseudoalteromonas sp. R96]